MMNYFWLAAWLSMIISVIVCWRLLRCVHAWELVDKTELDSGFENMAKAGLSGCWVCPSDYPKLSKRTVIIVIRCPKCGAAKILNP